MRSDVADVQSREDCLALDQRDVLAGHRAKFALPDDVIYLDGNSLGPPPKSVAERLASTVRDQWGRGLVRSWNSAGWIDAPRRVGGRIAHLLGARENEVVVADSTSVNLFKLLVAALRASDKPPVVLSDRGNFPSDLYIAQSVTQLVPDAVLRLVEPHAVTEALTEDVAVLCLTHVDYRTGRMHDLPGLTRKAHDVGAGTLWNLAHSAGAVPLALADWQVDYAVGCGYKYLNGGPGAPAFVFVAERLQDSVDQPLAGWLGHAAPFEFQMAFLPADGVARLQCGTPPILSLVALECGVETWDDVRLSDVRHKSMTLSELFIRLCEREHLDDGLALASPRDAEQRGSHLAFAHPHAYAVMQALIDRGVIGDFREPNLMRFGFAPLYLRYVDIWDAVATLHEVLRHRLWDERQYHARRAVT